MDIKFNGVLIPEEKDERDYQIAKFVPNIDEIKDKTFILPLPTKEIILNQKQYSSCVAHSFALCKSILEYIHTNKWIDFDPYVIYGTRKVGEHVGEGMYLNQAGNTLLKEGAFFRRDFNIEQEIPDIIDTVKKFKKNNPSLVEQAKNYTISGYGRANGIQDIKAFLKKNIPVAAAFPIYDSFLKTGDDGNVLPPSGKSLGSHCMTIIGWTEDNKWIIANSWGTEQGMKGIYYIPFTYPMHEAVGITDTIYPSKVKAKYISMNIGIKRINIDGVEKVIDVAPFIKDNRTYLPIRVISEALGASVEWEESTQTIFIFSEEADIKMQINNKFYTLNGVQYKNDVAPIIVNDRTVLPIRVIAECLNCSVDWDANKQLIIIKAL